MSALSFGTMSADQLAEMLGRMPPPRQLPAFNPNPEQAPMPQEVPQTPLQAQPGRRPIIPTQAVMNMPGFLGQTPSPSPPIPMPAAPAAPAPAAPQSPASQAGQLYVRGQIAPQQAGFGNIPPAAQGQGQPQVMGAQSVLAQAMGGGRNLPSLEDFLNTNTDSYVMPGGRIVRYEDPSRIQQLTQGYTGMINNYLGGPEGPSQAATRLGSTFGFGGTPGSLQNQAALTASQVAQNAFNMSAQNQRNQLIGTMLQSGMSPDEAMRGAERLVEGGFFGPFGGGPQMPGGGAQNPLQSGTVPPAGGAQTPLGAATPGIAARGSPGSSQRVLADRFDEVLRRIGVPSPTGRGPRSLPTDPAQLNQAITEFVTNLTGMPGFVDQNIRDIAPFMIQRFGGVPMDNWFTQRFGTMGRATPHETGRDALMRAFNAAGANVGTSHHNPQTGGGPLGMLNVAPALGWNAMRYLFGVQ